MERNSLGLGKSVQELAGAVGADVAIALGRVANAEGLEERQRFFCAKDGADLDGDACLPTRKIGQEWPLRDSSHVAKCGPQRGGGHDMLTCHGEGADDG